MNDENDQEPKVQAGGESIPPSVLVAACAEDPDDLPQRLSALDTPKLQRLLTALRARWEVA